MNFREESNYHKMKLNLSSSNGFETDSKRPPSSNVNVSVGPWSYSGDYAKGYKGKELSYDIYKNDNGSVQAYGGSDNYKNKSYGIRGSFNF